MKFARSVAAVVVGALAAGWWVSASAENVRETKHKSGISLVGPGPYQPRPANEAQRAAYHSALHAAEENPDQLGYPWLDAQGQLVQRTLTPKGVEVARGLKTAVSGRTQPALRSYRQLEDIKDEIIVLDKAGVPGAGEIWKTQPDEEHNRIIVTVSGLDDALMDRLAKLYGTQAIAVHVQAYPQGASLVSSRYHDTLPYSGGAAYDPPDGPQCTLGFAFTTGFITAGHCGDTGGVSTLVWDFSTRIGTTSEAYEENWNDGSGTASFPEEPNVYRGDIALIRTAASALQKPYIYIGTAGSAVTRNVTSMWWSESSVGDRYCTSGATTGELCDWDVISRGINFRTTTGLLMHATEGHRYGKGVDFGDSGGPVYTYNSDGSISAKGIIDAKYDGLAPHYYGYFTEIIQAWLYFPGFLKTGGRVSEIASLNSGKCLDVQGGSTSNGAYVIQYTCHGGSNQSWYWESHPTISDAIKIVNGSGKCLAIGNSSSVNGAKAIQWECLDNSPGQTWYFGPNDTLVTSNGKCLSVDSSSLVNGAQVIQWTCAGVAAQRWTWY